MKMTHEARVIFEMEGQSGLEKFNLSVALSKALEKEQELNKKIKDLEAQVEYLNSQIDGDRD